MKSISKIAWNVSEEEYRADIAISYSALSTFAREGQRIIPHLYDKKDAEALRFGSLVDCLLTEPEILEERFFIADFPPTTDKIGSICKKVFEATEGAYRVLSMVPDNILIALIQDEGYYPNWKEETRIRDVVTKGSDYYSLLALTEDRTIISSDDFKRAQSCVEVLRTHPFTKPIFFNNPFEGHIEKIFQLKFRSETLAEHPLRCMMDFCIVDHNNKTIRPVDLKTTGKDEDKFEDSFVQWRYMLQATLYSQILADVISKDDYFKDFTILPYWFTVINRYNQTPMTWVFEDTLWDGDFVDVKTKEPLPGWKSLLHRLLWHQKEEKFEYPFEVYQNNGIQTIERLERYASN